MAKREINTLIIGAGQGGLSVSYYLTKKGVDHLILEKGKIAEDWRARRWDNFRLLTPNFMSKLPGFSYRGKDPKGFGRRDEVIKFFEDYAKSFGAPVMENTSVSAVTRNKNGFLVKTNKGNFRAKNVVIAVGNFHKPFIPELAKSLPKNIFQIHSSEYKNSKQLPKGAILVVGAGNSGVQIALDLYESGRKVYLSVGKLRIMPRHYRGKDFIEWAELMGILDRTTEEATPEMKNITPPALWGRPETINLRKLAKNGIQLVGHLSGIKKGKLTFADNLEEDIKKGEAALTAFKENIDKFITANKMKVQKEKPEIKIDYVPEKIPELEIKEIKSVIWATGFKVNYLSWIKLPAFDYNGEPIHEKGVSKIPGLYFIGYRWLSKYKSFFIFGAGEDAEYIASKIN